MGQGAGSAAGGGVHGFPAALTGFVGRAGEVGEVAAALGESRLVTVTGPGGVGKTRLAGEVGRRVASGFADGVWLAELAGVGDPALVPAAVARALGFRLPAGVGVVESLAGALARRQVLLVLDDCEHVLAGVAGLCGELLVAADDLTVLATSREPLGVAGECRYRLGPLSLPRAGEQVTAAGSEAVALFADRAARVDRRFALDGQTAPLVGRLVAGLDGMPLAIELAAARVEALGVTQLVAGLADRFEVLVSPGPAAEGRHRSLAAAVEWSYRLLDERERAVFRRLAVLPGPFTLEGAEAVGGLGARQAVLRLVDCSLLAPPRLGADGRSRYVMLETVRAYGRERLAEAGEQQQAAAALAGFAVAVAEQAAAGLATGAGEVAAAAWLDAEDATVHHVLAWAAEHDLPASVRLGIALAPWWFQRGRLESGYELLGAASAHAAEGSQQWCAAQFWLGLLAAGFSHAVGLGHYTAVRDALAGQPPSHVLCLALTARAACLAHLGHRAEAEPEVHHALALAREIGDRAGEAWALTWLAQFASYSDHPREGLPWCRQIQRIDPASIPGWIARISARAAVNVLTEAGEFGRARRACAPALAEARHAGALFDQVQCLLLMTLLDLIAGRLPQARAHLREATEISAGLGANLLVLMFSLDMCGHLCALDGQPADALTAWAAYESCVEYSQMPELAADYRRRHEPLRRARHTLGAAAASAAEERGAAMSLTAAAEYAALLAAGEGQSAPVAGLSARERELVTLVAQGRTNTQIAGELFISVRTVGSHLDRIRDKTGCRRRADLTRLALQTGLV